MLKRVRKYFAPDSISEVYALFREKFNYNQPNTALYLLTLLIRIDTKGNIEVYKELQADLIELLFYKYCDRDTLILYNLKDLAR